MLTKIQKWGNSLAVRIPKIMADELKLGDGASVQLSMKEQTLVIEPVVEKNWPLDLLLAGVTDENRHGEWDSGEIMGRETW
jgi:antitoxin MazE